MFLSFRTKIRPASLALFLLAACAREHTNAKATAPQPVAPAAAAPAKSLYERLGGEAAISAVVDEFLRRVTADAQINKRFEGANIPRLRQMLIEQISFAGGGPKPYTGGDMKSVHRGMDITEAEFNALVGDLIGALDQFKVPEREKSDLIGLLAPMKADIVAPPPTPEERRLIKIERSLTRVESRLDEINKQLASPPAPPAAVPIPAKKSPPKPAPPAPAKPAADTSAWIKPRPWTPEETKLAMMFVERFSKGQSRSAGEDRRDLIGGPLEQTRFIAQNGDVIDLSDYKGKKVVLVIMRGFGGAICLGCSTQLMALADNIEQFRKRGVELFVVYPGDANTVPAFIEAIRSLRAGFAPPFPILLDVDLAAVRAFMIEGNLAKPTTLIIDESGIVRWAYVGTQPADRPSVENILAQADRIRK
ncbi:redoxin domain-containing protein [Candidatus Sumerlaeota bacterium]|nr:redoxin domain-containing protein [Candidatus Sumerlaeota bacterium]